MFRQYSSVYCGMRVFDGLPGGHITLHLHGVTVCACKHL